jgi:hypothetical protein
VAGEEGPFFILALSLWQARACIDSPLQEDEEEDRAVMHAFVFSL